MAHSTNQQEKTIEEEPGPHLAYRIKTELIPEKWQVDPEKGLSNKEVKERREKYGSNEIPRKRQDGPIYIFLKQFKDVLIFILFLAAGISWYADQMANVYIILGVILFNAIMGFVQEYKAEKAVEAIKKMVKHHARVIRNNGQEKSVLAKELVPGDVILLEEGQTVVADARLIESKNLRNVEASLTGESAPADKNPKQIKNDTEIADRHNMVWKGTHVVKGSGKAIVVATGQHTEIGKIARSLSEMEKKESNFRKKTGRLARKMAAISMITASTVFLLGFFYRNLELNEILMVTIASLVSSIPEGLPVVISIVLAIGAGRMAKRNAIIREFTATEVLGSVTTILTDKTGTITRSILTVKRMFGGNSNEYTVTGDGYDLEGTIQNNSPELDSPENHETHAKMLAIAAYCNKATLQINKENGKVITSGDPTEVALRILAEKSNTKKRAPYDEVKVLDDIPFNSEQKFRATLVRYNGQTEMFVVGAPEIILEKSNYLHENKGPIPLDDQKNKKITNQGETWADQALRVIGLAYKKMPAEQEEIRAYDVKDLVWTGILGIIDPPRDGVKESIETCRKAGIRVVMVTGDHQKTAAAIAREVGIIEPKGEEENGLYPEAMAENEFGDLRDEKFDEYTRHVSVFARVSPQTKMRIAERLQAQDELVAMTGDGVNDAPALKKADVGIAMGQRGTDVAKDAAQIVLSDDNFSSIVNAIHEGRIVFKNLKSTTYFLITTNFASAFTLITALVIGFPIPVTAIQILWINMVTDGIMDVAKATEPGHGGMMHRKPIRKNEPILKWEVVPYLLIMTIIMVGLALLTFNYYLPEGEKVARTGAFFVIAMTQVFNLFNMRDLNQSVFKIGFFSNKWINLAFFTSIALQLMVVKVQFLQDLFGFRDIPYFDFLIITILSTSVLWAGELYKKISSKRIGE